VCGIGGILRTDGQPIPEEWLDIIDARIAYRGPDGHGRFRDRVEIDVDTGTPALRAGSLPHFSEAPHTPGSENRGTNKRIVEVAFVHRRLSIIDHAGGHQPMVSERGRNDSEGLVAVVFNGCIYNHRELRKELEGKGHTFVTDHSDTEVLIHGWREWKEKLTNHLEGMYAFAVWDRSAGCVTLGRDVFGEKPLYFVQTPPTNVPEDYAIECLSFASAVEPLRRIHECHRVEIDEVSDILRFGYPKSFFRFPPGFSLSYSPFEMAGHDSKSVPLLLEQPPADELEGLLDQAVARRLDADVPLGCFLSGGIDSSLIALFGRRHDSNLATFAMRMPDKRYDESPLAQEVADILGTRHTTLDVSPAPADDLVRLIGILGQPFGDSSILPTYWVSRAAREHVKVALSGDGGDELFVGYERYLAAPILQKHHRLLSRVSSRLLLKAHPKSKINKLGRIADAARDFHLIGLAALESLFTEQEMAELFGRTIRDHLAQTILDRTNLKFGPTAALRQFDVEHYLPNDLLTKVDTASMACGLEVRCPFLDRDLARAALSMPIEQLMPGGQRKGLLRNIARKYLPKEIVDRPKMGFAIPIGEWFRSDYGSMKTLLLDHLNSAEPFGPISLNRKAVQRFIDEHMSGKRDHGQRLFTLLTLSIWARQVKAACSKQKAEIA
jgi:asparagine synthase (glutamine-hydrolysing)